MKSVGSPSRVSTLAVLGEGALCLLALAVFVHLSCLLLLYRAEQRVEQIAEQAAFESTLPKANRTMVRRWIESEFETLQWRPSVIRLHPRRLDSGATAFEVEVGLPADEVIPASLVRILPKLFAFEIAVSAWPEMTPKMTSVD